MSEFETWGDLYAERNRRIRVLIEQGIIQIDTWSSKRPLPPEVETLEEWYTAECQKMIDEERATRNEQPG